jgi:hypothetical protein
LHGWGFGIAETFRSNNPLRTIVESLNVNVEKLSVSIRLRISLLARRSDIS